MLVAPTEGVVEKRDLQEVGEGVELVYLAVVLGERRESERDSSRQEGLTCSLLPPRKILSNAVRGARWERLRSLTENGYQD